MPRICEEWKLTVSEFLRIVWCHNISEDRRRMRSWAITISVNDRRIIDGVILNGCAGRRYTINCKVPKSDTDSKQDDGMWQRRQQTLPQSTACRTDIRIIIVTID
ncbi:821_t:CDS:1 [Paraglomus occultum]|uniref:821_t:CDS:1 n=1 Tax=Paraglomus occultum TaxID=144539 RepID=A0A9N8ZMC7_9GLOM|nr:821_t:CDS:1 [Paraglomus occultum]